MDQGDGVSGPYLHLTKIGNSDKPIIDNWIIGKRKDANHVGT